MCECVNYASNFLAVAAPWLNAYNSMKDGVKIGFRNTKNGIQHTIRTYPFYQFAPSIIDDSLISS